MREAGVSRFAMAGYMASLYATFFLREDGVQQAPHWWRECCRARAVSLFRSETKAQRRYQGAFVPLCRALELSAKTVKSPFIKCYDERLWPPQSYKAFSEHGPPPELVASTEKRAQSLGQTKSKRNKKFAFDSACMSGPHYTVKPRAKCLASLRDSRCSRR
ncbi:hypothetical protein CSUI_007111, partial [Cystoisospora suis]